MTCILTKPCAMFHLEQMWLDAWIYITNNQLHNLKDNILQKVGVVLLKKLTEYIKPAIF